MADTKSPQDGLETWLKRTVLRALRECGNRPSRSPSRIFLEPRPLTPAEEDLLRPAVDQDGGHPFAWET